MRYVTGLLAVTLLVAFSTVAFPDSARGADPVAMVVGGGTADFIATPNSVNTSGYTNFSIGVTVYDDGTAQGHFVCQVPGIVIISGDVLEGTVNLDGSVTVSGVAHGYDHTIPLLYTDMPFTVTFRAGGPGVGGFDYRDESGFFPLPTQFDTELVRRGMIGISIAD